MIRAILFDLDGTLVDSERSYAEAMALALERGRLLAIGQRRKQLVVPHLKLETFGLEFGPHGLGCVGADLVHPRQSNGAVGADG